MTHIVQEALAGRLPNGNCKACDRNLVRRGVVHCRNNAPLNGVDAAFEFARNLHPRARQAVGL